MILEVATRGTDRLERKLSLDINHFIPTLVKDPGMREDLVYIAKCVATWCGCKLERTSTVPFTSAHSEPAPVEPAPVEPTPVETAPIEPAPAKPVPVTLPCDTPTWRERFDSIFGFGYGRIRLEDEENRGEKRG